MVAAGLLKDRPRAEEIILSLDLVGARNLGSNSQIKPWPLMPFGGKRLTGKYQTSKMFLSPNTINFLGNAWSLPIFATANTSHDYELDLL